MVTEVQKVPKRVARRRRWWKAFALALFLPVPVDLLTTLALVAVYGAGVEANPLMRALIEQGLVAVTVVNLLVVAAATVAFALAVDGIESAAPDRQRRLARGLDVWLGILLVVGVALVANNLAALL